MLPPAAGAAACHAKLTTTAALTYHSRKTKARPGPHCGVDGAVAHGCVGSGTVDIKLVNIGFGNIVSANRIVAIVSPDSAPIKRIITEARDRGVLIDATYGRRTRAVIITDSDHVVLSAVQPETVANRLNRELVMAEDADEDEDQAEEAND